MLELIVSSDCPFCEKQKEIIIDGLSADSYNIINVDSPEFEQFPEKDSIDATPFLLYKSKDGNIKYAGKGLHDLSLIKKIMIEVPSFNLKRDRSKN